MKKLHLCLVALTIWPFMMIAQEYQDTVNLGDTLITDVDLFNELGPMDMTLTFDIKKYQRGKYKEEYVPVELLLQINDTLSVDKSVRIRARGVFRRGHCSFAPFWLNINKTDIRNKHLQDVKKMKVVTHCNNSKVYSDYVLKEYLIYKIYNMLSPVSFRVRLIRMKYVDTGRKNKVTESWAILIEPEKMLAQRHDAVVIKNDKLSMNHMNPGEMDIVSLFELMIGNADYSIIGRHNMKILGLPGFGSEGYTPVPYDFDYTGLVNANYATPGENLGINSVRERYFLGLCREEQEYQLAMDRIAKYRDEILDLIHQFPYLKEAQKDDFIGYVESYFLMTESPDFIAKMLKRTCR